MKLRLMTVAAPLIALALCSCEWSPEGTRAGSLSANGITAKTSTDEKRFWISLNVSGSWSGGHTSSSGILPAEYGTFVIKPEGVILYNDRNQVIGRINGFTGLTKPGDTGNGLFPTNATYFAWTATR